STETNGVPIIITRSLDGGVASGHSNLPAMSHDGRFVVYMSTSTNLVANDTNEYEGIFLHDRDVLSSGEFDRVVETRRISVSKDGADANGPSGDEFGAFGPRISGDGEVIVFVSYATNL